MRRLAHLRGAPWLALMFLVLVVAGCSQNTKGPVSAAPAATEEMNLGSPNGGFTSVSEAPGFGDPALLQAASEEKEVLDPVARDPEVNQLLNGHHDMWAMTILWGALRQPDTSATHQEDGSRFDWHGTVVAKGGVVVLNSLVSFEPREGDMILPRSEASEVEFSTHTGDGYDGIRVLISRRPMSDPREGKDSLTVTVGSFRRTISFDELDGFDEVTALDDQGNAISIHSFLMDPTAATLRGYMRGTWSALPEGEALGSFQGIWVSERGRFSGYYRGIYGTNAGGEKILFGKITDGAGNFRGYMRGTWAIDSERNAGRFSAGWVDANEVHHGSARGIWRAAPIGLPGLMEGHWCEGCPPSDVEVLR